MPKSSLREQASRTAKVVWTGIGALATIGGVMGLVQFVSMGNAKALSSAESSQDVLMAMVKSGDIDVQDAERLAELLYGDAASSDTQGLRDIAESGSDRQKEALALLAERHTRKAGLDILEAEAETGADWRLVAELALGIDAKRSLAAVKKAIALNPEDFRAVTLMSKAQANTGDYASAQRSARTAEMLAGTPVERVMASQSSLSILTAGRNVSDVPASMERLKATLDDYAPDIATTPLPARFDTVGEAEVHPIYIRGVAQQTLAVAAFNIVDLDAVAEHAPLAMADLDAISVRVPASDAPKVKRRMASIYDNLIYAEYAKKNWPEMMRIAEVQLEIYRDIAESGDKRGQAELATRFGRYATYAAYADDKPTVRSASRRAVELARGASERRPDDADVAIDLAQTELGRAISLASIGDEADLTGSLDVMMTRLETALAGKPDDSENSPWTRYSGLVVSLIGYFQQDSVAVKDDPSDALLERAQVFLDAEILDRPAAHDPRHARNSLYLTIGDRFSLAKDVEAARAAYRRALDDAAEIPPTEDEPDVVELSQLVALHRLAVLEEDGVEVKDRPEFKETLELAQSLDRAGKLTTPYQPILNYLIAERDGVMPELPSDTE